MKRCILCLQELSIFQGLERKQFENVCLSTTKKHLDKGEFLFHQGDRISAVYLIKAGTLKLVKTTEEGREKILDVSGPGEVLGEISLFQEQEQPYSAVAMEETYICCFNKRQFEAAIRQDPAVAVRIINYMGQKQYEAIQKAGEEAGQPVREKLLRLFYRLAGEYGRETPGATIIELQLTQQELADMLGVSRVIVVQAIKELKEAGIIDRLRKQYVLKSDPCLRLYFQRSD